MKKKNEKNTLSPDTFFTLFVLSNFVWGMFFASAAKSITLFWNVNLKGK